MKSIIKSTKKQEPDNSSSPTGKNIARKDAATNGKAKIVLSDPNLMSESAIIPNERRLVYDYGTTINYFRQAKEYSQKDLAELCGLSVSYISEIINGKKIPDTQTLERICFELDISLPLFYLKAMKRLPDDNREKQSENDHIRSLLVGLSELIKKEEHVVSN